MRWCSGRRPQRVGDDGRTWCTSSHPTLSASSRPPSAQEEICRSLQDYNSQIEQLKQEMDDAMSGADNIRSDIGALAQRYTVIDLEEQCGVCRRKILTVGGLHQVGRSYTSVGLMVPFYVFSCGHAFHANCLIAHAERILDL